MEDISHVFKVYALFIPLLILIGIYCILVTHNLIRLLIGMEIVTKAVTVLLVLSGYLTNNTGFAQTLVITLIVIEAVVVAVAAGLILNVFKNTNSLHIRGIKNLKG